MNRFLAIALLACLYQIQICRGGAFSSNSFTVSILANNVYYLQEYSTAGSKLQQINLPSAKACAGCKLNLDTTGGIATIPMYEGNDPFDIYGYTYNIQGSLVDTTTLSSQSSTSSAFVMDGQDVWFNVGGDFYHTTRGSSGSGTKIYTSASSITNLQLVGTKLYALIGTSVAVMSPVVKSGTGTFTTVVSGFSSFYVYKGTVLYAGSSDDQYIYKYTLSADGTSGNFNYRVFKYNDVPPVYSMYAANSGGDKLYMVSRDGTYSYVYRYTDTGSTFASVFGLDTSAAGVTYLGISGSPSPTCSDGFKNQDETDVDCGGNTCSAKCANDKACTSNSDCNSNKCASNVCAISCSDGIKNQDETDVDCGGNTCSAKCAIGLICARNADCIGNRCFGLVCAESCTDGIKNQDEADVDCGGDTCLSRCADTKSCKLSSDCSSSYCNPDNKCSILSCFDGYSNQDESDIDCGGSICITRCAVGQFCGKNSDCDSNTCSSFTCVNAPIAPPVSPPVGAPVSTPVSAPVGAPIGTPVGAPIGTPVGAPVGAPVSAPVAVPINEPVGEPVDITPITGATPEQAPQSTATPMSSNPSAQPATQPASTPLKKVSNAVITMTSIAGLLVSLIALGL